MHHLGPIAGLSIYADLIATAGYDNRVILWDSKSRSALAMAHHDHLVNHCAFSADGKWLVSASSDYSARVWSVPSLRLQVVLGGHEDDVDMAVFSPDDTQIATCALDRCVRIFDLTGRCLHTMRGHTGNVLSLAWMQDGRHVISSSVDGTIRTWDTQSGTQVGLTNLEVRTDSVEISAAGTVYAGDDRGRIAILHAGSLTYVQAHRAGVKKIVLNEQQGTIVSLSYDRSMAVWRIQSDEATQSLQEIQRGTLPETIWARGAGILPDGRIACATFGATYAVFDPEKSQWDLDGVLVGAGINAVLEVGGAVYSVGDAGLVKVNDKPLCEIGSLCNFLVASHGTVLTGGQLGRLYDAQTAELLYEHHSPLNCGVAFAHGGVDYVAIGSYTGEVLVFAKTSPARLGLCHTLNIYENAVKGLSFSDGVLFSVCASTDIAWHSADDWSLLQRMDKAHERIANACCALDSGRFASVGRDRKLRLWDRGNHAAFQSPHPNSVKCLGVNAAKDKMLTGSYAGTLAIFNLVTSQWEALLRPTHAGISSISWDDAAKRFLAASYDGKIYPVAA